ncbi:protein FAM169B isoform X3 [Xyrichtys novacula]|uniref:Protein FAM169B isoform X3 n=1 Tax=Xyrichtys novacula TaxID=13765 RepID=A0AAV1F952_XYRNO|nr:protein FAM169B isoform X3 [Xyrichtys novacula]
MHPVDLPAVDATDLTSASEQYLASLESGLHKNEWFQPSEKLKVEITAKNVKWLNIFEDDQPNCRLLVLHPPEDPTQVVAVYLHEKWWHVDDILRTSSESRRGLMLVQSIMERVIVFLLSQVVERTLQEEVLFSLHPCTETCKLLWIDGRAVGFYTIKHKGSLCNSWSSLCYMLPVLDTVLVRRSCRRRGFGLQMLENFCSSFFSEKFLGISSPLSPSMVAVCKRFLLQHEEDRERLYEVEAPGDWNQRRNIWLNIHLGRYSLSKNEDRQPILEPAQRTEGDHPSQKTHNCGPDPTSTSLTDVNDPLVTSSVEQKTSFDACDQSQEGTSLSSKTSETECNPAAQADDQDFGTSPRGSKSLNSKQTLISKPSLSTKSHREEPEVEETRRGVKRIRIT